MSEAAASAPVRKLYELAGADPALRFSPYCWRIRLALAHKKLAVETIAWRFTEKAEIAFSGQGLVPVLVDGETVVHDSQAIAEYLETAYPEAPSLFGNAETRALTQFIRRWTETVLQPPLARILVPDIFRLIHPKDRDYFRRDREAKLGMRLEALNDQRAGYLETVEAQLKPLRATLQQQAYLAGDAPLYADHIVFGALQWAGETASTPLLAADDPLSHWMRRLRAFYDLQR